MSVTALDIERAHDRIRDRVRRTPVVGFEGLTLKLELLQHAGSFKVRGSFNNALGQGIPEAGLIAASGGNHGIAVAHVARELGIPAEIFVPGVSAAVKVDRIRARGAQRFTWSANSTTTRRQPATRGRPSPVPSTSTLMTRR